MLIDFFIQLPYKILVFFIPLFVWENWLEDCKRKIDAPMFEHHLHPDKRKEYKERERKVYKSLKGRLVKKRWRYSI